MELPKNCAVCGFNVDSACRHDHGKRLAILNPDILHENCPIKTDELDAIRFRVWYRAEQFYLCVSVYEGKPWEVFVEHATKGKHELQYMLAGWDTATRFISRDLKREPLESTIKQLDRSSRQKNDLPDIVATQLRKWL